MAMLYSVCLKIKLVNTAFENRIDFFYHVNVDSKKCFNTTSSRASSN